MTQQLAPHPKNISTQNPRSPIDYICAEVARKDFCFLPSEKVKALLKGIDKDALKPWDAFQDSWSNLAVDTHMADAGRYRKRRHATLNALPSSRHWQLAPHQPHYQGLEYNTLNGGVARHYEPITEPVLSGSTMGSLMTLGCEIFGRLAPYYPWHIEAHQFRIESSHNEIGKPTSEGIHRDGVNYVMMLMVHRSNLQNGATTIYDLEKNPLAEFTFQDPLDMAIVNDEHVYHGVTPITSLDVNLPTCRDVLVITFKRKL